MHNVLRPLRASASAVDAPITPAPITIASYALAMNRNLPDHSLSPTSPARPRQLPLQRADLFRMGRTARQDLGAQALQRGECGIRVPLGLHAAGCLAPLSEIARQRAR